MEFLARNKKWIGLVFTLIGIYVWNFGCVGLEQYCSKIGPVLTNFGTFLVGAGILPSDYRTSIAQGVKVPSIDPPILDKN